MQKLFKIDESGCWIWTGASTACGKLYNTGGYGEIYCDGKSHKAHRISYELHIGPISKGNQVLHKCDNRRCINPEHLFLGTNSDNIKDKLSKQRQAKGTKIWSAKLDDDDVISLLEDKKKGASSIELAKKYGIATPTVRQTVSGKAWAHIPRS